MVEVGSTNFGKTRLSTSLQKGILETTVGSILNKFKIRSRRDTLFFEDIITQYVLTCEQHGHGKDIGRLSEKWGELNIHILTPAPIKKISNTLIMDRILRNVWTNLGIVDYVHLNKRYNTVYLTTKNESITRSIGRNDFMPGFFNGIVNALYNSRSKIIGVIQSKESCEYQFELTHEPVTITGKDKSLYDKLNYMEPIYGHTLGDAFRSGMLQLKDGNRIYFREKRVTITENTIFHLVGAANIMLDEVPRISYDFFSKVIEKESTDEQKLKMLKNLLQFMGWGIVTIVFRNKNEILFEIKNPPYGLQSEKDDWTVLSNVILGYLWAIDKDFEILNVNESSKNLKIMYNTG
ncbi:MAG: hypothetical protein A7315_04255 [Candidatus Altiarchaeales archaeon WOR_SM1_79]|nr:MAG: hypothetical protein A7315_04255 [Candidatus Altiarchaeales archaeon WOR_SM1_79]